MLTPLDFPQYAVALTFALETPEGFLDGLTLTQFDKNHLENSPPCLQEYSSWGPLHGAAAQQMIMQMVHGLSRAATVIGQQAIAGGDAGLRGDDRGRALQMPQHGLVRVAAGAQARDMLLGHDEQMRRRLGIGVLKRYGRLVLVDDL